MALPVAPIAPEPPVPEVSTPLKVTTVIVLAVAICDRLARTETFDSVPAENARQISAVPCCVLVRRTSDHVRPPPLTPVTVTPEKIPLVETTASSSSFVLVVLKAGEVTFIIKPLLSVEAVLSIANCAVEVKFTPATLASTYGHCSVSWE